MSRWLKILLLGLAFAGVALLALPWWLALPLRPILRHWGVTFEHYEREGYAHFRLRQLHYATDNVPVEVTAGEVHAPTPLLWLAQHLRGKPAPLTATNWRVQPASGPKKIPVPSPDSGWPKLHITLQRVAARLATWLPDAELTNGEVRGLGPRLYFARVTWREGRLRADGLGVADRQLTAELRPGDAFVLEARTLTPEAQLQLTWSGAALQGKATWWNQPAALAARFPAQGWLPEDASLVAENWIVPAGRVNLGVPYTEVRGNAKLLWRDGAFDLTTEATALAAPGAKKKAPPFSARAAAHGNLRVLTLTALEIKAPFATGKLSAPVTFSLDAPVPAAPAQLAVKVDLAQLPWLEARGRAEGTVTVSGPNAAGRQDFALEFSDVELPGLKLKKASARGHLQWPLLALTEFTAQLDETSAVSAKGEVNWETRELAGVTAQAKLGDAWFARWLPKGTTWQSAEFSATAEGPWAAPRHTGTVKIVALASVLLNATDLDAAWHSQDEAVEFSARTRTGNSTLELAGALDAATLQLDKLQVSPGGQPAWQLAKPVRVARVPTWSVDTLELTGPASQLAFSGRGGRDGFLELTARGFDSTWLRDWITLAGPAWQLHTLQAKGKFQEGVLVFSASATAQIAMNPRPAEVKLVATGAGDGIRLQELAVTESGRTLTQASGRLPLAWILDPEPHLRFDEAAPLELSASTEPDSPLWAALATFTGLELTQPAAKIELTGSVQQPTGEVDVKAARLGVAAGRFPYAPPELTELSLALQFARTAATLTQFSGKVDGQAVAASGQLPLDDAGWRQLLHQPAAFDWSRATARVEIPHADLTPLAKRFPKFVAARGFLRAAVELRPGGKLAGELHLTDAASRPLPPFGTLQEIQADLVLDDHTLTVHSLTARLGGEAVHLTGSVTFVPGSEPRLALALQGKNLPVVRNPGLLLRADIDLQAKTDAAGTTTLGGRVDVRDCLLLSSFNLRTLLPSGPRGVMRPPPYFAVNAAPFSHWPLALEITAQKSVRLRTTVFNGTASGHFRLGGTLGEPRAIGEVTTDDGRVLFPFATFMVKSGSIRLRESDPFHAILSLTATAQRQDYQLKLEATGELPAPNVLLTSSPALEPGEVLLLVMTGQPPNSTVAAGGGSRLALLGAYLSRGLFQDLGVGGEDRLEISAGAQVSGQGRDTYEFEYKLGARTSLVGEYDRFDSYNAGIKWRAYTQESTPVEKK